MPISDEIIELAPVKKSRTMFIIMFAIMGVLLAAAVTFLVLYLLKPSVEATDGRVVGVTEESTSLCLSGDGDDRALYAAVGNEYTVYATVSAEGSASKGVTWSMDPVNSLIKISEGVDPENPDRCYFTFKPDEKYADGTTLITLTARSESDPNHNAQIRFYIRKQGTEEIVLKNYWRGSDGARNAISSDSIVLPYYSDGSNNLEYYISFEQLGAYDAVSGARVNNITVEEIDGVSSLKVDVTSSDTSVVEISQRSISETANPPRFNFTLKKAGEAKITITANAHNNFAEPVTKELTVTSASSASMNIIEQIFFAKNPVDAATFETLSTLPLTSLRTRPEFTDSFVMPYQGTYNNILDHIVLYPLSIQYDSKEKKLKTGWKEWVKNETLEFVSSDTKKLVRTLHTNENNIYVSLNANGNGLSNGNDCKLTVRDKTATSLNKQFEIKVNIVAQNNTTEPSLTLPGNNNKSESDINAEWVKYQEWLETRADAGDDGDELPEIGFAVSQDKVSTLNIEYTLLAPADTQADSMLASNHFMTNFVLTYESSIMTIVQGSDFSKTAVKSGVVTALSSSAVKVVKVAGATGTTAKFTATATFSVRINSTVERGIHLVTFQKIGLSQPNSDRAYNDLSPNWETNVVFHVETVGERAIFVDEAKALEILTDGDKYKIASYSVVSPPKKQGEILKGTASITVQNQLEGVELSELFDFRQLVVQEDTGNISVDISTQSSTAFTRSGTAGNHTLVFNGNNPGNTSDSMANVLLTVYNINGAKIAEFTVYVYVVDPIKSLYIENAATVRTFHYGSSYVTGNYFYRAEADTVKFEKYLITDSDNTYNSVGLNVKMYYVTASGEETLLRSSDNANRLTFFLPNTETPAFVYNGSYILQAVDFFKFCYDNKDSIAYRDLVSDFTAKFVIEYCINESDKYITDAEGNKPTARRTLECYRDADAIGVYGVYANDEFSSPLAYDSSDSTNSTFKLAMKSGSMNKLYIAAIVNVGNSQTVIVPSWAVGTYSLLEEVYVEINGNFSIQSAGSYKKSFDQDTKQYYYITFEAQQTAQTDYIATWHIQGSAKSYSIKINVQNYTRSIQSIELYRDEDCTTPNKLNSTDTLNFGRTSKTGNPISDYIQTVYVKVTYQDVEEHTNYNAFESARIKFPTPADKARFTVEVDNGAKVTGDSVTLANLNDAELTQTHLSKTFKIVIYAVAEDGEGVYAAERMDGDLTVSTNASTQPKSASVKLKVATGLDKIEYKATYSGNVTGSASGTSQNELVNNVRFSLKNADDEPTATLALSGYTYGDTDGYNGLSYDGNVNGSATNVDGLIINVNTANDTVEITVDKNSLKALSQDVDITFTDAFSNSCVFKLHVDVTMEVYQLGLTAPSAFTTTGGDGNVQPQPKITVTFNNGRTEIAPSAELRGAVEAEVLVKKTDDGAYISTGDITADVISTVDNTVALNIPNSLLKDTDAENREYWVRVKYAPAGGVTVYSAPVRISFTTTAQDIRLKSDNNVSVNVGAASIDVLSNTQDFKLVAETYNLGTGNAEEASGNIVYKLTDTAGADGNSTVGNVQDGIIHITNPDNSGSGTVFLKISYTDGNGNVRNPIDVEISYKVMIATATPKDGLSDTITLYMYGGEYTYIEDITAHFDIENNFSNVAIQTVSYTVKGGDTNVYKVEGSSVKPVGAGVSSRDSLTVDITDGMNTITKTISVSVVDLSNALALGTSSGEINLASNSGNSVEFTPSTIADSYDELDLSYSVTSETNKVSASVGDSYKATLSFNKSEFTSESDYKAYTVNANAVYSVDNAFSVYSIHGTGGKITVSKPFTLTAKGEYAPEFKIARGADKFEPNGNITLSVGDQFKVELNDEKIDGLNYTVTESNDIVTFSTAQEKPFEFTVKENRAGVATFTVTAMGYGKTYRVSYSYTFVYGYNVSDKLYKVTDGRDEAFTPSSDPIYIDYASDNERTKFKYEIDASGIGGNITKDDIIIDYTGTVEAGELSFDTATKKATMEFTAIKATTLIIRGSVRANGVTYYLDKHTLYLAAHEPEFTSVLSEINATASGYEKPNFVVTNSNADFKGNLTVTEYSILSGGEYATVNSVTGEITVNSVTITRDVNIVVRATIAIDGGAHDGATYTYDKVVTIKGVALPTITWDNPTTTLNAIKTGGKQVDLKTVGKTFNGTVGAYTYTTPTAYTYSVVADGFTANSDYTLVDGVLTINYTDATKKGGRIEVTVSATLGDGLNSGETVRSDVFVIVIEPQVVYTVTFVANGGTLGDKSQKTFIYDPENDVTFSAEGITASRTGYTFAGWYDSPTSDENEFTEATKITGNMVAYAHWTAITYTNGVTLNHNDNGESSTTQTITVTYDSKYGDALGNVKPTRTGYDFVGWYTGKEDGDLVTSETFVTTAGEHTLYAHWVEKSYTVVLYIDGEESFTITVAFGETLAQSGLKDDLTRTGYAFEGWYESAACSGDKVSLEAAIGDLGSDYKLYARWVADTYTVTLKKNDGTDSDENPTTVTVTFGKKYGEAEGWSTYDNPTRVGYDFVGWYTDGEVIISAGTVVTIAESHTLTARWTAKSVTVIFSENYDGGDITVIMQTYGESYVFPEDSPTRTGYRFDGWFTTPNKVDDEVAVSGNVTNTEAHILYAHWTAETYTVTLDYNYGEADGAPENGSITVTFGSTYGEGGLADPTRDGYRFDGWYSDNLYANKVELSDTVGELGDNYKLYAKWLKEYTVTLDAGDGSFNSDGGTSNEKEVTVTSISELPNPDNAPVGMVFAGWFTSREGGDEATSFEQLSETSTFYAHWTAKTYTVILDVDGNKISIIVTYGKTFAECGLTDLAKDGYRFEGWYSDAEFGEDNKVELTETVGELDEDYTLYAKFTRVYKVTLHAGEGATFDGGNKTIVVEVASFDELSGCRPVRVSEDDMTFEGWFESEEGDGEIVTEITGDIELYAKWQNAQD